MSELATMFITSGITVLGGTTVFVIGQIIQRIVIEPIHEQRRVIARIAHTISRYPTTAPARLADRNRPVKQPNPDDLRQLAIDFVITLRTSVDYDTLIQLNLALPVETVRRVSLCLYGWQVAVEMISTNKDRFEASYKLAARNAAEIRKLLKIDDWMEGFTDQELFQAAGLNLITNQGNVSD